MVHFLRRKDSGGESRASTGNSTITSDFSQGKSNGTSRGSSSNPILGMGLLSSGSNGNGKNKTTKPSKTSSFSFTREDQQLLLDYMVEKLRMKQLVPQMQTVASTMINPCTACTVPKDIMTYYDSFTLNDGTHSAAAEISMDITNFTGMSSTTTTSSTTLSDDDEEAYYADDNPQNSSGLRFGLVHIQEYNRTVGDHPDVSDDGPPLALDWDHGPKQSFQVGQYEARKRKRRKRRMDRRIERLRLEGREDLIKAVSKLNLECSVPRVKGSIRREVLHLDFGVPFSDLAKAEAEVKKIQKQREESNQQTLLAERTEELLQSAGRKLKRSFLFGRHGIQATSYYGGHDDEAQYRAIVAENLRDSKLYGYTAVQQQSSSKLLDRRQPRRSKITPVQHGSGTNSNSTMSGNHRYRPYKQTSYRGAVLVT